MNFGQKTHPLNFEYGSRLSVTDDRAHSAGNSFNAEIRCEEITAFCTRLRFANAQVTDKRNHSDGILDEFRQGRSVQPCGVDHATFVTSAGTIEIYAAQLQIHLATGVLLQTTVDGFGFNGETFILNFDVGKASAFYGFGERTKRLNKDGDSLDFWTVDVVATFRHACERDDYDPAYVAIPWVIIKTGPIYSGLYFDNPGRAVIDVGKTRPGQLMYQSRTGHTDLYIVEGPSLRHVVRHFSALTGTAEVPPLWSLGYHQCRWGYRDQAEFRALQRDFAAYDIPLSALWYDIDYMDGFRLFTWNPTSFPSPAVFNRELREAGIRTVTIVDPGVKREHGYSVYEDGKQREVFCKTASHQDYVGRVWPGDTVFPDFSQAHARDWWAGMLAAFIEESAIDGVWLDMNDPATGFSAPEDMLFANGTVAHDRYHNQYAHGMAQASRQAFDRLDSRRRPFLLSRSGFTGTQRYSAIWTGDNASNWQHLRMAIPCTLNLGLSGVAFNGPDVGGFLGHTTPELLLRWYQACFLFPFFRNHSARHSQRQEPWQFGEPWLACIRETIKTRYRLLPYLYTCFFQHYLTGDPVVRPLAYEYTGAEWENLDDQFLVGDAILVAPILTGEGQGRETTLQGIRRQSRYLTLPPGWWFDLNAGAWIDGGRTLPYAAALDEVPLFIRDGAIIPYYHGLLRNSFLDLHQLELHIFTRERPAELTYFIDDPETRDYRHGGFNTLSIRAAIEEGVVQMRIREAGGYTAGTVTLAPVVYGQTSCRQVVTVHNGHTRRSELALATRPWLGKAIPVLA